MSQGTVIHQRLLEKDFTVATPEEFVRRFKGTRVINKVCICAVSYTHLDVYKRQVSLLL